MEEIINKRKIIKDKINKFQKEIYKLQTTLIDLDKEMEEVSNLEIIEKMELSDQQKKIVESESKNMLVIACPGSGKTHTLISRYIYLVVKKNVDPNNIILITFTNKAGKEMNERISNIIPNKYPYYVGSLHGLSYRLIQKYNKINYTILDEQDSKSLLKVCCDNIFKCEEFNEDEEKMIKTQIAYIYDKVSTSYPLNMNLTLNKLNINSKYKKIINKILKDYKKEKKEQLLLDFNDLMIILSDMLEKNKVDEFLEKIEYIFFDEYQDVNPIQNFILSKFNNKSNIMVVGDDAQSIYSFRGSSVEYIWNFEKNFGNIEKYYLETNYRSTKRIINLFQNIISYNTNQYDKKVISNSDEKGLKPQIISFSKEYEQNNWVVEDIIKKYQSGVKLNDMVVLARTNRSLSCIEMELIKHKIPIVKSLGSNLLNKSHIKDFIAFLIVITNKKSLIHWKRVLAIHRNIGIQKANFIIENNTDIEESLCDLIKESEFYKKNLEDFYLLLKDLNNYNLIQKIYLIQKYLEKVYKFNGDYNLEKKMNEILALTEYFGETSIEDFISNIYLDQYEDFSMDDVLFLSTVHGAKGLEWKYVYLIDVTSKNFPCIKQNFYLNEYSNVEEERRLFYVAASRAKKELLITYSESIESSDCYSIMISPFIRELNSKYYLGHNINFHSFKFTGKISTDVNNYLRFMGYNELVPIVTNLNHERKNINTFCKSDLPIPNDLKYPFVVGNFMDYLIAKILHVNFPKKVNNFDLNLIHLYPKFPKNLSDKYKDKLSDWRDILEEIYYISTYSFKNTVVIEQYKDILINEECKNFYLNLEKSLIKFINKLKPKEIKCHYNITYNNIKGECDILIDNKLFELKVSQYDACTFSNLCQTLLYGYLLKKKEHHINSINIYNIFNGTLDTFDTSDLNFIDIKKIIYKKL